MNCKVLVPLPVSFRQRTPERLGHLIDSIVRDAYRAMDVRRVIFCATGVIEFKSESQISLNPQLCQSSLDDRS